MKRISKNLTLIYILLTALTLAVIVLFETDMLESGLLAGENQSEFIFTFVQSRSRRPDSARGTSHDEVGHHPPADTSSADAGRHLIILYVYEYDVRLSGHHAAALSAVCIPKPEPLSGRNF